MIKKSRLINLRIEDQLLDEIEKIAIEKFNENTSEAIRYLCNLGIKFELIPKNELDKEKIEEITNEMNQKIKDESFFEFINSFQLYVLILILFVLSFISIIACAWGKQQEKFNRRHREWMKENLRNENE